MLVHCDLMNYLAKFLSPDVSTDKIFPLLVLHILYKTKNKPKLSVPVLK